MTLIDGRRPQEWVEKAGPGEVARRLGLLPDASGLVAWDVFDSVRREAPQYYPNVERAITHPIEQR